MSVCVSVCQSVWLSYSVISFGFIRYILWSVVVRMMVKSRLSRFFLFSSSSSVGCDSQKEMSKNLRGCFLKENKVNGKKDCKKKMREEQRRERESLQVFYLFSEIFFRYI